MASVVQTFAISAGGLGPVSFTSTGTEGTNIGTTAPNNANTEYPLNIDITAVKSIFLYTDGDLTVTTNAQNGSGGQNFTLTSGVPFFWNDTSGISCPVNTNTTSWWWHNASNTTVNVYGIINQDV